MRSAPTISGDQGIEGERHEVLAVVKTGGRVVERDAEAPASFPGGARQRHRRVSGPARQESDGHVRRLFPKSTTACSTRSESSP